MMVSYNSKDKVGTSFLLGSEEDIAKECASLMLYNKDHWILTKYLPVCLIYVENLVK